MILKGEEHSQQREILSKGCEVEKSLAQCSGIQNKVHVTRSWWVGAKENEMRLEKEVELCRQGDKFGFKSLILELEKSE